MRIIHLLKHCHRGNGHVHVAVDLACEQAARGHDVVFASGGGTYEPLLEARGVRHISVPQTPKTVALGLGRLLKLVARERPHVVHAHMMAAAAMGYVATRAFGGALVTTVHNSFDSHSRLMRLGDRVVAVSRAERDLLVARGYPEGRISVVHNGPLGSAREDVPPDGPDAVPQPCIMTLSGLHGRKRVDDAIAAFASVSSDFPDWHLVIVGEGPDEAKLKAQATSLGLEGRILFTGRVMRPERLLRQAAIFVSLSVAEPFGLVVAEARAAGCAIVVTRVGGMPEVVEEGRAGVIVPPSDVLAAGAALRQLMGSADLLARWRAAAIANSERFSVPAMADGYESIYAGVAGRQRLVRGSGSKVPA